MLQATELRTFYLWSAFGPNDIDYHPTVDHLLSSFKMYNRQVNFEQTTPQLTQLFLFTNDKQYGAMMEAFDSGTNLSWSQRDPTAEDLKGLWAHSFQVWKSKDQKNARELLGTTQDSCMSAHVDVACPSDEIPPPATSIPAP